MEGLVHNGDGHCRIVVSASKRGVVRANINRKGLVWVEVERRRVHNVLPQGLARCSQEGLYVPEPSSCEGVAKREEAQRRECVEQSIDALRQDGSAVIREISKDVLVALFELSSRRGTTATAAELCAARTGCRVEELDHLVFGGVVLSAALGANVHAGTARCTACSTPEEALCGGAPGLVSVQCCQ